MRLEARHYAQDELDEWEEERAVVPTIEEIIESPDWFGVAAITPLQRAICRLLDGRPLLDLAEHPHVLEALGGTDAANNLPERTREFYLLAGIRGGKSLIATATAIRLSQLGDLNGVLPGEVVRVPVLSTSKDNAAAVIEHLDSLAEKPAFASLLARKPKNGTYTLRHPQGNRVEIKVVAGSRAGNTLTSRWCLGVVFDEWPRMMGGEHVVNFADSRKSVLARLRPGGLLFGLGSPWAPFGPAYDTVARSFGKPSRAVVVMRGRGRHLNPTWWNPERIQELSEATDGQDILRTEEEAEFGAAKSNPFTEVIVAPMTRKETLEPDDLYSYVAAMDPATRRNAWTLVISTKDASGRLVQVLEQEWKGTTAEPLKPEETIKEVAAICLRYRVTVVDSDQWSGDALAALARAVGLTVVCHNRTANEKLKLYRNLLDLAVGGLLEVMPGTASDLKAIQFRKTQQSETVYLPENDDKRHCDYAPSLLAVSDRHCPLPRTPAPLLGSAEATERERQRMIEAAEIAVNSHY